jgi:hypothetical protein
MARQAGEAGSVGVSFAATGTQAGTGSACSFAASLPVVAALGVTANGSTGYAVPATLWGRFENAFRHAHGEAATTIDSCIS